MASVYVEISRGITHLREETTVTKRREAGQSLIALVSNHITQERLLQEASGRKALCAVWSNLVGTSLLAAERAITGKGKLTAADVMLPHKILQACKAFSMFSGIESLLSSNDVRTLLNYCLVRLAEDDSLEVAETDLLVMLHLLCSRPDYVCYYRPHSELNEIMAEIEVRVSDPAKERSCPTEFYAATKVFEALLKACQTVGTGVHVLIPSCLQLVHGWARHLLKSDSTNTTLVKSLPCMFGAAATLLACHPEQCILEMAHYGRSILKLARRCYPQAQGMAKDAIVEYILGHLLVCQTAGRLQGLLPGDLGDVGSASLDSKLLSALLEAVAADTEIEKMNIKEHHQVARSARLPSGRSAKARLAAVQLPAPRARRHFELCARLLSCAQRLHLAEAEWNMSVDPVQEYLSDIPNDVEPEDHFMDPAPRVAVSCPLLEFVKSPWMTCVAVPLWFCLGDFATGEARSELVASQDSARSGASATIAPANDLSQFSPVLRLVSEMHHVAPNSAVPFLQLVCACAETFPLGECWTSNTQHHWHTFTPEVKEDSTESTLYCNGCSPDDIALVVCLVTNVLEACGRPNGDEETQVWALICLVRLTESSALVSFSANQKGEASAVLHLAWQRVWHTLFNSDLRYASYTRSARKDSIGELVLVLLTEMIRRGCTEASISSTPGTSSPLVSAGTFAHTNQDQVWSLDAFSNADAIHVQAVFDLTHAMLKYVGLVEEGRDVIDGSEPRCAMGANGVAHSNGIVRSSRRYRLIALCLRYTENNTSLANGPREVLAAACACLSALISGKSTPYSPTFAKEGSLLSRDGLLRRFCVTDAPVDLRDQTDNMNREPSFASFFRCLWDDDQIDVIPPSWYADPTVRESEFCRAGFSISTQLLDLQEQLRCEQHRDFISPTTSATLKSFGVGVIERMLAAMPSKDDEYELDFGSTRDESFDHGVLDFMVRSMSLLKILMGLTTCSVDGRIVDEEDMNRVFPVINSAVDEILARFPSADQSQDCCAYIMTDLLQVLRALMVVSMSNESAAIPDSTCDRLASLVGMCMQLLKEYSLSRATRQSHSTLSQAEGKQPDSGVESDMDDELWETKRRPTKPSPFTSDSSDSDGDITRDRRKRKRSSGGGNKKSKRRSNKPTQDPTANFPNFRCAKRLSSIVVLLQPSYGMCKKVAESLALQSSEKDDDRRGNRISYDSDFRASLHCLALFCSEMVVHRNQTLPTVSGNVAVDGLDDDVDQVGSIVSLCCSILQEIRSSAGSGSIQSLFGFEVCSDLVRHRECVGATPLNPGECDEIVELLRPNAAGRKLLKLRPLLRARQLAAAISILQVAQEQLHAAFDQHFKTEFVMPYLLDLCEPVRKQSTNSIGAAIRVFTQQENIVKSVTKLMPPLLPTERKIGALPDYRQWYEDKSLGFSGDSSINREAQIWDGALNSFQAFAIENAGVITASCSDRTIFRDSLFGLIRLAAERPDLELLCFHACERAAVLAGFGSVHEMLHSECEFLVHTWIDTGLKLVEMPLLWTAPTVLLRTMKAGMSTFLLGPGALELSKKPHNIFHNDPRLASMKQLREEAVFSFIDRSAHFLVPVICVKMPVPPRGAANGGHNHEDSGLAEYLEETASIVVAKRDDTSVMRLVRAHLHDILAYVEPLLHNPDHESRKFGEEAVKFLEKLLSVETYERLRRKNARLAVRRLLQLWGKEEHNFGIYRLSSEVVEEAIKALTAKGDDACFGEAFIARGTSVTECLLHSKYWLSRSVLTRQKVRRWSAIELISSFSIEHMRKGAHLNTQLGYCIHTMLHVLSDTSFEKIYPQVLQTLVHLLQEIVNLPSADFISTEIGPEIYRLIGTLLVIHERSQNKLVEECLESWETEQDFLQRGMGLWLSAKSPDKGTGDVWGWDEDGFIDRGERIEHALGEHGSRLNECLYETLIGTYDALDLVLKNLATLRGEAVMPLSSLRAFATKEDANYALSRRNPKLCAQTLARDFVQSCGHIESPSALIEDGVSNFLNLTRTMVTKHLTTYAVSSEGNRSRQPSTMTIDSKLLLDELCHLEEIVGGLPGSPMEFSTHGVTQQKRYLLIQMLLKLCEFPFPVAIQLAASRCLGAIGPCGMEKLGSVEMELSAEDPDLLHAQGNGADELQKTMSSCLELLSEYLLSPRTATAITALESAKAILSSREGSNIWKLVESEDCRRLLGPFAPSGRTSSSGPVSSEFSLPTQYVDSLVTRALRGVESTNLDANWCWRDGLWKLDDSGTLQYKDWVRFVTCAMITCCYVGDDQEDAGALRVHGSGHFFPYCVKLCALEHEFAARAFPGIVMDLLLSGDGDIAASKTETSSGHVRAGRSDSLANKQLSSCFAALINGAPTMPKDGGSLKQSPAIKAISLAVETLDRLRIITQKRFLVSTHHKPNSRSAEEYDKKRGQCPVKKDIPYGVVLRLNGLQVAHACMLAKRYASALFYTDMYSDQYYGGAGGIMERLSNDVLGETIDHRKSAAGDISGLGEPDAAGTEEADHSSVWPSGNKFSLPFILKQSYSALGDDDAAGAVEIEDAAMGFLDGNFKWNASTASQGDALGRLKALDAQCHGGHGRSSIGLQIVQCMEEMGLETVLRTYIDGMVANQHGASSYGLTSTEQSNLRDRWFGGSMKAMQWNGDLFNSAFATEPSSAQISAGSTPLHLSSEFSVSDLGFHEGLSRALTSFLRDDIAAFRRLLVQSRTRLINETSLHGEAPIRGMVEIVEKMQVLNDLDGLSDEASSHELALKWQSQNESALGGNVVDFPRTSAETPPRLSEFVVTIREVMLRAFQHKADPSSMCDFNENIVSHLWQISAIARRVGYSDLADSCVRRLHAALQSKHSGDIERNALLRVRFEEAMVMECHGDFSSAIRALKLLSGHLGVLKTNEGGLQPASEALYADALLTCGEWMNRYKVEPARVIMQNYLMPASELASHMYGREKNKHTAHRSFVAHLSLAQLVSGLYDSVCKRVESPEWKKAGRVMKTTEEELGKFKILEAEAKKKSEAAKRKKKKKSASGEELQPEETLRYIELFHLVNRETKELGVMKEEREKIEASIPGLLHLALESYGTSLAAAANGEASDISRHVYRLVSLWFANCDRAASAADVNQIMSEVIERVPSFRFVPLTYQIFSRLGQKGETNDFQDVLKKLVSKTCAEHPYHCLVQLIALSNGKNVGSGVSGRHAEVYLENVDDAKVESAEAILTALQRSESDFISKLIDAYRALINAYISLAMTETKKYQDQNKLKGIAFSAVSSGAQRLDRCLGSRNRNAFPYAPCVLSKPPAIHPGGDYGDGVDDPVGSERVVGFEPTFSITETGLHRPKILYCIGSKGGRFKQVVKGGDDIRQDAVMQQVFCYVNDLMRRRDESSEAIRDPNTMSRGGYNRALKDELKVVTYNIVPLSPVTGVMEWVNDTIPFGDYLADRPKRPGAHSMYYPGEWGLKHCRQVYHTAKPDKRRQVFDEICKNFSPAFRFFFAERFGHSLPAWYAAKMKYTRSCAVSSMVGHMLGIGDRHSHNILIREKTGEVVHIDFGIVFDQGKILPTPETVPFRLTRDIVDGMGPSGTEGTFSRAAEATTRVLRGNTNALLTILSAVVSDPLYNWNVTPRAARQRQGGDDNEVAEEENETQGTVEQENEAAARAIAKIHEKLQGYEDGTSGEQQSVEGQVQLLINSARDPDNLSSLYSGWAPWL